MDRRAFLAGGVGVASLPFLAEGTEMTAPTLGDFVALRERVEALEARSNQESTYGLNQTIGQVSRRFRSMVGAQAEYQEIVSSTTETTIYSVTFPPNTFGGTLGRSAFVSLAGTLLDADAGNETYILRVKTNGTTRIEETLSMTALSPSLWTWDTRLILRPDRGEQLLVSRYEEIVNDGTLTTGRGSYAGPAAVISNGGLAAPATDSVFGDLAQPNTLSFTVELGANDTDLYFRIYQGITELV